MRTLFETASLFPIKILQRVRFPGVRSGSMSREKQPWDGLGLPTRPILSIARLRHHACKRISEGGRGRRDRGKLGSMRPTATHR